MKKGNFNKQEVKACVLSLKNSLTNLDEMISLTDNSPRSLLRNIFSDKSRKFSKHEIKACILSLQNDFQNLEEIVDLTKESSVVKGENILKKK